MGDAHLSPTGSSAGRRGPWVGVDVGGTKTHILAEGGTTSIDVIVPSAQWRQGSLFDDEANFDRLAQLILDAVGGAPDASVVGAHGIDNAVQRARATRLLDDHLPGRVDVRNDALLLGPAMGCEAAICIIAGTGSIVVGTTAGDEMLTADGHGWLLADDASAPGLTRNAVVEVLRQADRHGARALEDPVAIRLLTAFDAIDAVELALHVQASASDQTWGAFAPQLFSALAEGSEIARTVIDRAGDHLADMVAVLRARGATGEVAIAAGGVITAQPELVRAVERALGARSVPLPVRVLDAPPAKGALALARPFPRKAVL